MSDLSTQADSALGSPERLNAKMVAERRACEASAAPEEDNVDQDLLRLEPQNLEAKRALDSVVRLEKAGQLSDIHARSLKVTGQGPLKETLGVEERPSDETTPEPFTDDEDSRRIVYHGYFRIGFRLTVSHPIRWTVGRGTGKAKAIYDDHGEFYNNSRNLDILLAAPKSTAANKFKANHAFFSCYEQSGTWLVRALGAMVVVGKGLRPTGILNLIEWATSKSGKNLHSNNLPIFVYMVHKRGLAFKKVYWTDASLDWNVKRILFYQLLKGLETIHGERCMHRDITPQNLLFFQSEENPKAVLCDFSKYCECDVDTDTSLAGWRYLPPEMVPPEKQPNGKLEKPYDQAIDIWMLGLALIYTWWPETSNLQPRKSIDRKPGDNSLDHYKHMNEILDRDTKCHDIAGSLKHMISWDPRDRIRPTVLLQAPRFAQITRERASTKTSDAKRLHKD
ncbi:MAG: hypothetical protein Q9213_004772 [Squamulea squamosa]